MTKQRILVCDDEPDLRELVGEYLTTCGFDVLLAAGAAELDKLLDQSSPDLIILDVRMPGEDGLSALRRLRNDHSIPVMMLTAADGVVDRILGLEMGADDYVGKPVDLRELEARVKALLRRGSSKDAKESDAELIRFGSLTLDVAAATLRNADEIVPLTAMEFALLKVFVENSGRVLSRDQLLDLAHHRGWEPFDRSIDLRISRLRRKIEPVAARPQFIKTVRGLGYIFSPT